MIKFFRKIRQKLLSDSKFSQYLIYAIGEIVLVVIGILIALQIDNWNTQRFERKAEEMEQRLIDYLCENESLFPEYSTNEGKDELKPINKAAAIPFPLGGKKKQSWRNRRG